MLQPIKSVLLAAVFASVSGLCQGREIVVGQVLANALDPLLPGYQLRSGVELYFDVVNKSGGVAGASLRLATKERSTVVSDAVPKTQELIDEVRPMALIALSGTGSMNALVKEKVFEKSGLPAIGIRTGATALHEPVNRWLFHTRANYAIEAEKIVNHLTTIGFKKIAVFYENSAYGKEALKHTLSALEKAGLKPVAFATYELDTTDVAKALSNLRSAAPDAVIAASTSGAASALYKGIQQGGAQRVQMVAFSTVDAFTVVKLIGRIDARGLGIAQVVPDPGNRRTPIVREFQDNAKKLRPPQFEFTQGALEGYIAAKVLVEGLKRAGPNVTSEKLRLALETMPAFDSGGMPIKFTPSNHSGTSYVNIGILASDGKMMQ